MTSGEWERSPLRVVRLPGGEIWLLDFAGNLLDAVEGSPLFFRELERHREGESFEIDLPLRGRVRVKLLRLRERLCAMLSQGAFDFPFATLVENDPQDIFYRIRLSPERHFEYVSPSVTRITGYTPEEHYLDPDLGFRIVHPEDHKILSEVAQGKWFGKPVVLRWVRKDGEIIYTEQVNVPVYDDAGNLVALEGIARDVTEGKRLEEAFQQKNQEFEWLLENMINAFVVHEAVFDEKGRFVDFRILYVNRAYEDMVGVKRGEVLGRTARELWPGMEEEWFRYLERVARTGIPQVFEFYHAPTRRYYRCRAYNPWGKGDRYCVVFDNVTEQKLAIQREEYLKRMLLAIRNVNQLITQEEDPHRLIEGACRRLTETMSIFNAWIVRLDEKRVVDFAAYGEDFLGTLQERLEKGDWPSCLEKALQEKVVLVADPPRECSVCFLKVGYEGRSGLALSLSFAEKTYGVLVMSVPREFFADREVLDLLREMAQDLGFALYKFGMRESLREAEERYRLLAENAPGVVYLSLPQIPWLMLYLNDYVLELTGYSREDFLEGRVTYAALCHPEDLPQMEREIQRALEERRPFHLVYRLRHRDGTWRHLEEWGVGVFREDRVVYLEGFIQDVTERELARERIEYLATHDLLTGFYNRGFLEKLLEGKSLSYPVGLLLCDLNGLRLINDAFGQKRGDEFLAFSASLLRDVAPEHAFLFRFGGDELLALVPGASETVLRDLSHALRSRAQSEHLRGVPANLSMGWSLWEDPAEPFEEALSRAEQWLRRRKLGETQSAYSAILNLAIRSLQETTQETEAHARRLVTLTRHLGEALKLRDESLEELELLAHLHDLGKIAVPSAILDKPGPLTPQEWEIVKRHPEVGYRIAQSSPELAPIAQAILAHHERYDGTGYPQGLRGEEIPLLARILAVVDAYDVMRTGRPYKPPMSQEEALAELRRFSGTQFDPRVVEVFITIIEDELREL